MQRANWTIPRSLRSAAARSEDAETLAPPPQPASIAAADAAARMWNFMADVVRRRGSHQSNGLMGPVMALLCRVVHDVGVRVLVVEDHAELANDIADGLRDRGMAADVAYDGARAIEKGLLNRYDVIVLDRDVPKVHGDAVCVALTNAGSEARILMLTAAASIGDRVEGLNLGADDYLPKPFAFEELVARVLALARRSPAAPPLLLRADLVLDRARRRAVRAGRELLLSRKELGVLEVLMAADGAVVSAEELLERVWDENADPFTRTVTVRLGRLRRKLGDPDPIETVVGAGYRIP